jgi:ATP-dependent HslUV protease subunit HslV
MFQGTTIVAVRKDGQVAIGGDGQVSIESTIVKSTANKVRRMYQGQVLAGFAGSVADALTLYQKFEGKLEEYRGNLKRSAYELAREWRTDRVLRRLEAMMVVANRDDLLLISGNGDVIEPDEGVVAIGSGGAFARAAALALYKHTNLDAETIVREALAIAASICIFTNNNITVEKL